MGKKSRRKKNARSSNTTNGTRNDGNDNHNANYNNTPPLNFREFETAVGSSYSNNGSNNNSNNNHENIMQHITEEFANTMYGPSSAMGQVGSLGFDKAMEQHFQPLAVTDVLCAEISQLSLNSRVYMVDVQSTIQIDNSRSSGFDTEVTCTCGLVEKETGSNGRHWNSTGIGCLENKCDGLSHVISVSALHTDARGSNFDDDRRMLVGTIAKACKHPGAITGPAASMFPIKPSRPSKILFTSQGLMSSLEEQVVKQMGIPNIGVADKKLAASMRSSFSRGMESGRGGPNDEAMMRAMESGDTSQMVRLSGKQLLDKTMTETYYVNEERVSLQRWTPDPNYDSCCPVEWFACPPPKDQRVSYRPRMLWGWRTNLELAVERNDATKIKDLCQRYPPTQVQDVVEMRMLLSKGATLGTGKACRALLKYAHANVDGVRSVDNQRRWVPMQQQAGDDGKGKGCSPLFKAVHEGHDAVVRLLIENEANIQCVPLGCLGSPLHFAVHKGHQNIVEALIFAGAELEVRDSQGQTPLDLCWHMLEFGEYGTKQYSTIAKMLQNSDRIKRCAACDAVGPRHHCPCKLESYCNKECQTKRWKKHKHEHKEEMEMWAV